MNTYDFIAIERKYKKCPNCNANHKSDKLSISLENETVTVKCECGWMVNAIITTHGTIVELDNNK